MPAGARLLIRNASLANGQPRDVLIEAGRVAAIDQGLNPDAVAETIDARGGCLLPGLNDHHIHLAALAVARTSLHCGPPAVASESELVTLLHEHTRDRGAQDWIRGTGYHESVAGDIDAAWLDAVTGDCPVRIQHRGGRLWIFNSRALELLRPEPGDPPERVNGDENGQCTGRLYEGDAWLRERMHSQFPDLAQVSLELAAYGITGVTDTTPQNSRQTLELFKQQRRDGLLLQSVLMMGDASLDISEAESEIADAIQPGAHKFHLLESRLPDIDDVTRAIKRSHDAGRNVAFHCVTRTELVFALAAIRAAGSLVGDRIEHASVAPPELVRQMAALGLCVVTQPGLVAERGDRYLRDVAAEDQPWLYRLRGLLEAGIPLAGSSDAPFTSCNPWQAMHAAVTRQTANGQTIGPDEALAPEQALGLFTSPLQQPGTACMDIRVGTPADLCLLSRSWSEQRRDLAATRVQMTLADGRIIHSSPTG